MAVNSAVSVLFFKPLVSQLSKSSRWGIHFIQVHPMGCGLAAPEQECEIARIVRVAAKPTHTRIHCGSSLRAATPRIGRATQPHAAPEQQPRDSLLGRCFRATTTSCGYLSQMDTPLF